MKRRPFLQLLGGGLSVGGPVGFAGCTSNNGSSNDDEPVDGTLVEMTEGNRFEPETVTVPVGETVVWRNVGAAPHSVTAYEDEIPGEATYFASGGFEDEGAARDGYSQGEGRIPGGESYEHTFNVPGQYGYFCVPHESGGMTGTVVVEDRSESPTETSTAAARREPTLQRDGLGAKRPGVARPPETIARRPV